MSSSQGHKSQQPVVLFQADGSVMKGVVFLRDSACSHSGRQPLADLLGEKGDFLAFRSAAGSFCLVNKTAITHLRCDQIPRSALHSGEAHYLVNIAQIRDLTPC